ncbi:response regulator transcription factor (plasmid) [Aminobacter sp. SR38]|jgi:DNA-binding NarL/FixJ family response regulator|uniref:response regulator transcription factor n=1 Tax=Aminobacter sp. SR38 TaxID=2774562 RepID=UPI00177EF3A5|nr:response regulator transcription factor [Aminobacter sp. SR38]QOF75079.1 response regulator transcription factor [Aminobacter sp. SR38]
MSSPGARRRPVILCVEDEDALRRDIADELAEAGYEVIQARDGEDAFARLERAPADLILCDISMPGLNGYDLLQKVRAGGLGHAETPFVFLSALADPRQIVDGKRLGADDYLVKPINYDLLLATLDARLRQIKRIRSARTDAANAAAASSLGLTPAEIRIATSLTRGKTLAQIAVELGISRTTVAFHMRNIFNKTGTSRQGELIALLLRHGTS